MKSDRFELFMGCLGNGTTVCNKAAEEHGDYKKIAHISPAGNITWYVKPESIPGSALLRIERTADADAQRTKNALDRDFSADPARTYYRMLDRLTISQLSDFLKRFGNESIEIKYANLLPLYLKNS